MAERPDDAQLRNKLLAGDVDAFRQFFRERSPEVVAVCKHILGSLQDAEDVTADVFFEVWSNRERFDPNRGSLRTYLLLLARSRSIDRYRRKARENSRTESTPIEVETTGVDAAPHRDISIQEFHHVAKSAMNEIAEQERVAIELSFFEGLSHAQISSRLDVPLGTIKSHIRRGLSKLRQKLQEWEF